MQIENTHPSSPRFDSGSCHHFQNAENKRFAEHEKGLAAEWQQNWAYSGTIRSGNCVLMIAANRAALDGFQGLAEALAHLAAREMGVRPPRPHYGHTFIEACPDFDAVRDI